MYIHAIGVNKWANCHTKHIDACQMEKGSIAEATGLHSSVKILLWKPLKKNAK